LVDDKGDVREIRNRIASDGRFLVRRHFYTLKPEKALKSNFWWESIGYKAVFDRKVLRKYR